MVRYNLHLLYCGIHSILLGTSLAAKSGPFISSLVRADKCISPTLPYQKNASADVTVQLYNVGKRTMLRGNYTTYRPDPSIKLTVQDYFLVNDRWQQTFRIGGMSCRGRIVAMMGQIFGINFNKKTCSVPKGVYVFNNIDYDFVDHVFLMSRDYGSVLRKVVVTSGTESVVCLEFESVVTAKT